MIARLMALLALRERAKVAVHNAQEAAAEAMIRIAIKLVAAVFLLIAFIYGTIALYLWLATIFELWAAMAIVAGAVLVLGLIILMLGGGGSRSHDDGHDRSHGRPTPTSRRPDGRPHTQHETSGDPMAMLASRGQEAGIAVVQRLRRNPEAAIAVAVGTGFLIGRSAGLRKLLLAGVSAALGAQASNKRDM